MITVAKPYLTEQEARAARDVILSGWVAQGPRVKEFEEKFARYVGAKHACAVSNCTTALHLALLAVGVNPGERVITVSHSFIATANAIRYCGAEPIFVDVDPKTYNMSIGSLEECIKHDCGLKNSDLFYKSREGEQTSAARVAAILIVHQMGMPCDLSRLIPLAKKYHLPVIEDAACAIGSEISFNRGKKWEKIGRPHGDIACFSFHPRKVLTTGEGGMITTNNLAMDEICRHLRHQGMSVSDVVRHSSRKVIIEEYPEIGFNYRMTDIQAAIGIVQLKKLPAIVKKRRELANIYQKKLSQIPWISLPVEPPYARTNWQSFPVEVLKSAPFNRDQIMQYLLDHGVSTRPGIMNAHEERPYHAGSWELPHSERARRSVLILPLFHTMKKSEIMKVIGLIKDV